MSLGGLSLLRRILIGLTVIVVAITVWNASWRVAPPEGGVQLIAHRGVHQTFSRDGLTNETCTAERIFAPTHGFMENTLASMRAAFAAGAGIVELDVHPTTDGHLAVIHDWTLDCRTDGTGVTRERDLAYLKSLDIGYGYTADGGRTYPLRGTGIGLIPELEEVFAAFPGERFLINYKSNEKREGDMLAAIIARQPAWRSAIWGAYGGDRPTFRTAELMEGVEVWSRRSITDCLLQYAALGWTGFVPEPCRDTAVMVPLNVAPFAWGWPDLFIRRMQDAGSQVILLGPYGAGDPGTAGIDTIDQLDAVPDTFAGYVWTNRIEVIGLAWAAR